ncbi:MAG TPA: PAAR domain-containing protein [Paraburkholderia sp.]|uniref:PAAR domain-containing protein n=1 Tax=Paraburkholderia sp. TaxID=1926495 RepID=UPI002BE0AE27|nr:PAAR domain-containing protein [Paraburkholderia sp.]HTR06337.1 PAAR domain-containing protein [Paraburkholderia sp.]
MGKALVCNGDRTTTGGHVIAMTSTMFDGERRIALDQDMATCGKCPGEYPIRGTGSDVSEGGRASVVHDDMVLCPCGSNHVQAQGEAGCSCQAAVARRSTVG